MISLQELMSIQFDAEWGSPAWLERKPSLGFDPLRDINMVQDLLLFGPFPEEALREGPSFAWVPRRFHDQVHRLVLSETGGATGSPKRVYFSEGEFRAGFLDPFVAVAKRVGWPEGARWLYAGPSGPHIIGRVVEPICHALGSPPPFQIDFDPRWARRLVEGSVAKARYLEHLASQTMDILNHERVEVLFATPPLLFRLGERMSRVQRETIQAVHYGGMAITPEDYRAFQLEVFPNAVHLSGYGNSLVGVAFEASSHGDEALSYFPTAERHQIRLIPLSGAPLVERLQETVGEGETGQVVVSRLDETCFLPNLVERDQAERVSPSRSAISLGWRFPGIHNPRPVSSHQAVKAGFY